MQVNLVANISDKLEQGSKNLSELRIQHDKALTYDKFMSVGKLAANRS